MMKITVEIEKHQWDGNRLTDNDETILIESCHLPTYKPIFVRVDGAIYHGQDLLEAIRKCIKGDNNET